MFIPIKVHKEKKHHNLLLQDCWCKGKDKKSPTREKSELGTVIGILELLLELFSGFDT